MRPYGWFYPGPRGATPSETPGETAPRRCHE